MRRGAGTRVQDTAQSDPEGMLEERVTLGALHAVWQWSFRGAYPGAPVSGVMSPRSVAVLLRDVRGAPPPTASGRCATL